MIAKQDVQPQEQGLRAWSKVAIIILNWNGWQDTIECLESINKVSYENLEVIIIDNASMDSSPEMIAAWCVRNRVCYHRISSKVDELAIKPVSKLENCNTTNQVKRLILIELDRNTGFCKGNNIGMEQAAANEAEYFLILNNDTIVTTDFLKPMVGIAQREDNVGMVGGIICYAGKPDLISFAGGTFDAYLEDHQKLDGHPVSDIVSGKILDTDLLIGCLMLIPRRVYEQVGGFHEAFFLMSEDWEYSIRVKKAGYRIVIATASCIYHKVGQSLGVLSPLAYYYGTRNRLLLKRMYLPWPRRARFMAWFLISRIPRYLQFAIQRRWDLVKAGCAAIRDYFFGRTGKWREHVG